MKRLFVAVGVSLSFLSLILPAQAQSTRLQHQPSTGSISTIIQQEPGNTIELYLGHGTTLDFRLTQETIRKVWIDDPSQVTLGFDDDTCLHPGERSQCAATVIHLRRIHRLKFPNLPATATTSLTVMTDRSLHSFRLSFPNSGNPRSSTITIQPNHTLSPSLTSRVQGPQGVQLIEEGLQIAEARHLISRRDALWNRLRSLLSLVRRGVNVADAARQVGVSQQLVAKLVELGLKTHSV